MPVDVFGMAYLRAFGHKAEIDKNIVVQSAPRPARMGLGYIPPKDSKDGVEPGPSHDEDQDGDNLYTLLESLKFGTLEIRSNSAAALSRLSALDSNKDIIVKAGALKPLVELLDEGQLLAMKDAATAILNLSVDHKNKGKAVSEGIIKVIMKKITDRILIDELLAILALLSSHHKAIEEMRELGAVSCLLSIIKEDTSDCNKENCIAILYAVCCNDGTKLKEILIDEKTNGTISNLARSGTSRAKRKANGILKRLN